MLELRNVQAYYGNIQALKGITLSVNTGEIVTLIGSNGAGKSTTLMTISSVVPVRSGSITFQGRDITRMTSDRVVAMGVTQVPEGRMIFPALTVLENLRMGGYLRRDRNGLKDDEDKIFQLFPILKERRKQYGGTLSGGEQQMLAIGRALMARPKLLLLDEPSLGLAPIIVENIFDVIAQINAEGTSILLVEQNAQMALQVAHRAYVLETGRVTMSGKAADLLADPKIQSAYLGGVDLDLDLPEFQDIVLPLLKCCKENPECTNRLVIEALLSRAGLSEHDLLGQDALHALDNRVSWVRSRLDSAGLTRSTTREGFEITEPGKAFLAQNPSGSDLRQLMQLSEP